VTVVEVDAAQLLSTAAVRERCANIAAAVTAGRSASFRIDRSRLPAIAKLVAEVTRRRYPDLRIPYHSRWRHFAAGGVDRSARLTAALAGRSTAEVARARIDLAIVSVLLDAGAGPAWRYVDPLDGAHYTRSEGLGVASFEAFMRGAFSADRSDPYRADAQRLRTIDAGALADILQATAVNPVVGIEGRAALLRRLGHTELRRPGDLFDLVGDRGGARTVGAPAILRAVLDHLGPIWPQGRVVDGVALGDTWEHPHAAGAGSTRNLVPFHKLSQWLTYSLFEPFEWAGIAVCERESMTALPEYRNGGLLVDGGAVVVCETVAPGEAFAVGSALVVEWRALTVALIDEIAPLVRAELRVPDLPLACILEGGTWAAGRELAQAARGGQPPFSVQSDGTVF
jgi:hypothetical protein